MSVNWSGGGGRTAGGGEGILRGGVSTGNKEELLVFGYSCKLFRDDERAREVDQGRLLIPWAGDDTLRIDRYDARGALHELASLEAPPGGHDWRLELTDAERRVEQLCDEERYRALYCDEEEELMYKEEELKRLRAAGYGQIGFNYDSIAPSNEPPPPTENADTDEPFTPTPELQALLTPDIPLPETQKLNAIIEKTATFIARQGAQMEILLRAKQAGNAQFDFLDKERPLHRYYRVLLDAVRHDKLAKPHKQESEVKPEENEDYLHPSLAAPLIESAPSIPSIHYKPSADCDYTMLISRIRGTKEEEPPEPTVPAGELAPPGTQPLTLPVGDQSEHDFNIHYYQYYDPPPHAQITRAPVLYAANAQPEHQLAYLHYPPPTEPPPPPAPGSAGGSAPGSAPGSGPPSPPAPARTAHTSTGLNLMHYYNSGSESEHSDNEENPLPPPEVQLIISKMAAYVARNGDEFRDIVLAKNDPRFTFLEEGHPYHEYYMRLMLEKRGVPAPAQPGAHDAASKRDDKKKAIAPVSFSIKKLKEPESLLPKPALPYESSDEDKETGENDNANKTTDNANKLTDNTSYQETATSMETTSLEPSSQEPNLKSVSTSLNNKLEVAIVDETFTFAPPLENSVKKLDEKSKRAEEKLERKRKKDKRRENGESKKGKRDGSRSREKKVRSHSREKKERSSSKEKKPRSRSRDRKERSHSKDKKEQSGSLENKEGSHSREKKERSHSRDRKKRSCSLEKKERSRSTEMKQRSPSREKKDRSRSEEREKQSREEKKEGSKSREGKSEKEKAEVVITIGDRSEDELIDLTGDLSDGRESNGDRSKQTERKRRAAAFLAAVGRDATAVHPPPVIEDNTLASAMVKTLVELRAKKEAAEERQRRRERQKHRQKKREEAQESSRDRDRSHRKSKRRKHRSSSDEHDDGYNESSSKRRKHRKEKKHRSSSKNKRRKRSEESSRESSKARERRRSESPKRRKNSTESAQEDTKKKEEENAKKKSDFDAEAIKNKLKMLREESDEELEVKRWRAESHESEQEKKKKEYSEGELESSDDKPSSSCGTNDSE